ncbi:hypothetical protein V1511DRAFT_9421 [Dipodascopsis uninucleata]
MPMRIVIDPDELIALFGKFDHRKYNLDDVVYYGKLRINTQRLFLSMINYAPDRYSTAAVVTTLLYKFPQLSKIIVNEIPTILKSMLQLDGDGYISNNQDYTIHVSDIYLDEMAGIISESKEIRQFLSDWARKFVAVTLIPMRHRKDHRTGVPCSGRTPFLQLLKSHIISRDGTQCLISGDSDFSERNFDSPVTSTELRLFPILPTYCAKSPLFIDFASMLTGGALNSHNLSSADLLLLNNWMLLSPTAIQSFVEQKYAFSASVVDSVPDVMKCVYRFEKVDPTAEFPFVSMPYVAFGNKSMSLETLSNNPDMNYCNFLLAVAQITIASGAAGVIDRLIHDQQQLLSQHSYLDGRIQSWTVLTNKLLPLESEVI